MFLVRTSRTSLKLTETSASLPWSKTTTYINVRARSGCELNTYLRFCCARPPDPHRCFWFEDVVTVSMSGVPRFVSSVRRDLA